MNRIRSFLRCRATIALGLLLVFLTCTADECDVFLSDIMIPKNSDQTKCSPAEIREALSQFKLLFGTLGPPPANPAIARKVSSLPPNDDLVLVAGGAFHNPSAELLTLGSSPTTAATAGPMMIDRVGQTANLLGVGPHAGQVLITGGQSVSAEEGAALASAERYDPASGTFTCVGGTSGGACANSMVSARDAHTATTLEDGTVLVAGGYDQSGNALRSAEIYDPSTDSFSATSGSLPTAVHHHTATLIDTGSGGPDNGEVLIAGGTNGSGPVASAALYDPVTKTFTSTAGAMTSARLLATATFLDPSVVKALGGDVLIAGGYGGSGSSAELFDPKTNSFTAIASPMNEARAVHGAVLLPNGKVLLFGGINPNNNQELADAELFDPATQTFTSTNSTACSQFSFNATPALGCMIDVGEGQQAVLLPDGTVLIAGGFTNVRAFELFDPATNTFNPLTTTGPIVPRSGAPFVGQGYTATLLGDGQHVVLTGGAGWLSFEPIAEVYDATTQKVVGLGNMVEGFAGATATVLQNGSILFAGGGTGLPNPGATGLAELLNFSALSLTCADGSPLTGDPSAPCDTGVQPPRFFHSATLLQSGPEQGQVLIAGGDSFQFPTAELYDPSSGLFTCVNGFSSANDDCNNSMTDTRFGHTATFLTSGAQSGKVLIAGGTNPNTDTVLATAELFDPSTNTFVCVGSVSSSPPLCNPSLKQARFGAQAFLLNTGPNTGDVLIADGSDSNGVPLATAELYDPNTNAFSCVGGASSSECNTSMVAGRAGSAATMLADGRILFAGGVAGSAAAGYSSIATAEIYDPAANHFTATAGPMTVSRAGASGVLLSNGDVLIVGGASGTIGGASDTAGLLLVFDSDVHGGMLNSGELFDPGSGTFSPAGPLVEERALSNVILVQHGTVSGSPTPTATATATASASPSATPTATATQTVTPTATPTATAAAELFFAPKVVNFPPQIVLGTQGNTSKPRTLKLFNPKNRKQNVSIDIASITSDDSEFTPSDNCVGTLAAGASCPVSVTFTPDAAGKRTGHLDVTSNATNPSISVTLRGSGTPGVLTIKPKSVNFGRSPVGTPVTEPLTLVNDNPVPMGIGTISSSNAQFTWSGCANSPIAAKGTCPMTLMFTPSSKGRQAATLTIDNDGKKNPTVRLIGVGIVGR